MDLLPISKVDRIRAIYIVGFVLAGLCAPHDLCLMQRLPDERCDRPVYVDESSDRFLYFVMSDSVADGNGAVVPARSRPSRDALLAQKGHWVISTVLDASITSCLAHIEDNAITPDQTNGKMWSVAVEHNKFEERLLTFTMEEWDETSDFWDEDGLSAAEEQFVS